MGANANVEVSDSSHHGGGVIHGHCYIASKNIRIGKRSYINRECLFDISPASNAYVLIGNDCAIGYRVSFLTSNHEMLNPLRRAGTIPAQGGGIVIEDGCWIGAQVVICPNVHIHSGTVIAAGAVVTKDCEANSLYAGVPARKLRELDV